MYSSVACKTSELSLLMTTGSHHNWLHRAFPPRILWAESGHQQLGHSCRTTTAQQGAVSSRTKSKSGGRAPTDWCVGPLPTHYSPNWHHTFSLLLGLSGEGVGGAQPALMRFTFSVRAATVRLRSEIRLKTRSRRKMTRNTSKKLRCYKVQTLEVI